MIVDGILPFARKLISSHVTKTSIIVDATCGNGNDTQFLASLTPKGHVFAFDIQEDAIRNTKDKTATFSNIDYHHIGHENAASIVSQHYKEINASIFNLGYLPKGDKQITTTASTTISAIQSLFDLTATKGIIVLVIYPGHPEGKVESREVIQFVENLDQQTAHVLKYEFINQKNDPPYIIAIEKR